MSAKNRAQRKPGQEEPRASVAGDGLPGHSADVQQPVIDLEGLQGQAAELQKAILDALPANVALVNPEGVIVTVNESWRQFGDVNAIQGEDFFVGHNYLEICERAEGECSVEAKATAEGIRRVLRGEIPEFSLEYPCHSPTVDRWYRLMVSPLRPGSLSGAVVMHIDVTQRKTAELALSESERRQRQLAADLESERIRLVAAQRVGKVGSWETDLVSLEVRWSEEMHRIFETDSSTFVPDHAAFLALIHPDDREAVSAAFLRSLDEEGIRSIAHRVLIPPGRMKIVEESWQVFRDGENRPVRAIGTCRDITERTFFEEDLRRAEAMARMAGRLARVGSWSVDLTTMVCTWSEEVCAIHGKPADYSPGVEEALDFYAPEHRPVVEAAFRECARNGTSFDLELEIVDTTGRLVWVRSIGEASRDAAGNAIQVQGAFQDISERKRSEQENRVLADRLVSTLENITDAFVTMDGHSRFTYVNHQAEVMLKRTKDELIGFELARAFPEIANTVFEVQYWKASSERVPVEFEAYYERLGRWLEVRGFPASDGLAVYFRDVTEGRKAREDLNRTHRALQMLSRCNEALIRNDREAALLTEICAIAADVGGYCMAWVGYAMDDERRSLVPQASSGADDGYVDSLQLSWSEDDPLGWGPAGRTVRTGQPVIVENLETDDYFQPWVEAARARGYRSMISLPLSAGSRVMGNLALYSSEPRSIAPDELKLLRELADNLAFGIGNLRSRLERRKTHDAVLAMSRGLSAATGAEFFDKLVLSLNEVMGAELGCIAQLVTPGRRQVRTVATAVDGRLMAKFDLELAGMPCDHLDSPEVCVIPRDLVRLHPAVTERLPGEAFESYVGMVLRDGTHQPIGVMFAQSRSPLGESEFVASTLRIFAARAAAELEREKVAARTREQAALLDKAQDAILVRDLDHRILFWNKSAERLYGWSAHEAIGQSVRALLYFEPGPFDLAMEHLVAHGEWVGELVQTRKDGSLLTIEGRWTLVRNEAGEAHSVLAINTDITERKKLEAQFLRAQRMESIGTLAGGIAHDLNNLLAPIMMGVDLLRQFEPKPDSQRVIGNIERSARRGADLVKQVLSFARGVEGSRVAVHLKHIVHEIEVIGQNTFPKNIRFNVQIPRDLWLVTGDPTQLNQVLLNLCVNARDAMPDGGTLTIAANNADVDTQYAVMNRGVAAGRYVTLEVCDTGCGMSAEVRERIFEPFFTTKEVGKGTGLGLSTVVGIVRSHGGFINVYSEPGRGSTFRVYLPAQEKAGRSGEEMEAHVSLPRGAGQTVLLVDDEAPILEVTRETLESFGYRVLTAEDGAQAIGVYATHRDKIAVVLTDMMMPVMDGAALIAALRRISPMVKIIAASGLSDNGNVARASGAGVRDFLAKPYSADAMLTMLHKALNEGASRPPMSGPGP